MYLTDGRGRERNVLEGLEYVLDPDAKVLLHCPADQLGRERWSLIQAASSGLCEPFGEDPGDEATT